MIFEGVCGGGGGGGGVRTPAPLWIRAWIFYFEKKRKDFVLRLPCIYNGHVCGWRFSRWGLIGNLGAYIRKHVDTMYHSWTSQTWERVRASPATLRCGPWARHIYPSLELVHPRETRPCLIERLLMGHKESNQTNKKQTWERGGLVVECLARDRGAAGSSLTGVTALCHWARILIQA